MELPSPVELTSIVHSLGSESVRISLHSFCCSETYSGCGMYACIGPFKRATVSNLLSYASVAVGSVPIVSLFVAVPVSELGSGVEMSRVSCQEADAVIVPDNISMVVRMMVLKIVCIV